jgi:hypothetical protein
MSLTLQQITKQLLQCNIMRRCPIIMITSTLQPYAAFSGRVTGPINELFLLSTAQQRRRAAKMGQGVRCVLLSLLNSSHRVEFSARW